MIATEKLRGPELDVRASHDIKSLRELADSIKELGLLQPITVRARGDGYEVVTGNRRRMACRALGMETIQCVVIEPGDGDDVVGMRLHENLIRRDMTPIEEAAVYAELFERVEDIDRIAAMCHRSREVVERRLALLAGDADVRDALHEGKIAAGVAEELNRVTDPRMRHYLLDQAIKCGVTVATCAEWRRQYNMLDISAIDMAKPPEVAGASPLPPDEVNMCWLCGSAEDQHDLRVRMVHQTCERIARRQAEQQARGGGNGG